MQAHLYFVKSCFEKLKPITIYYRNHKKFDEVNFLDHVKSWDFSLKTDDPNEKYDFLTNTLINTLSKHALLKKKFIRGKQTSFMTWNLSKEIYTRSRFRNKFCQSRTKENEKLYGKQRHRSVTLKRRCIKEYFRNKTDNNIVTNKVFWNCIKPFLKGSLSSCKIMLRK